MRLSDYVVNIRGGAPCDVYVGRGSPWGNPFSHLPPAKSQAIYHVRDRAAAIAAYEDWIVLQPELMARVPELAGKRLGCWCAPLPCHAEILARLANVGL